jgi:hypothetical protein
MANWKAELLRYAGMMHDFTIAELRESAKELEISWKGIKKYSLKWDIYKELSKRTEEQEGDNKNA